jgi:hypothetical protein
VPGFAAAFFAVTNSPVAAERWTVLELLVPVPTRSVVVLLGQRAAAALLTKRPDAADRLTLLPI